MKLPLRKLTVAGAEVKLTKNPKLEMWGTWDCDNKTITLGKLSLAEPSQIIPTIRHELRHAAIDLSGVSHGMTAKTQEQIVRCMENIADPALAGVLKKFLPIAEVNPELLVCPCCGQFYGDSLTPHRRNV